jgi:hypothetical protein
MNRIINPPRPAPTALVQARTGERPWPINTADQPRSRKRGSTSSL